MAAPTSGPSQYLLKCPRIYYMENINCNNCKKHKDSNRKKNISLPGPSCSKAIQYIAFNEEEFGPTLCHTSGLNQKDFGRVLLPGEGAVMAAYIADHNDPVLSPQPN
uniref:Uncharacterized protein n=1 Tax=Glossina austeni TaxID=7395 RepID=A0A1A9VRX4_GLOAU